MSNCNLSTHMQNRDMQKLFSIVLFVFISMQSTSQEPDVVPFHYRPEMDSINYVKNPSFEEFTVCPITIDRLKNATYWYIPPGAVLHSPEFFHRCSNEYEETFGLQVGVPKNFFGYQESRTGDGYIGISTFGKDKFIENVQTQLKQPLIKGEVYRIGMYVSLAEKSKYAHDRFTFCLTSHSKLEIQYRRHKGSSNQHLICPNGAMYRSDALLTDTLNWVNIEVEYTATGGEKYLTLGVFDRDVTWWERQRKIRNIFNKDWDTFETVVAGAYYYIDDVYVIRKEDYLNLMKNDEDE